MLAGAYERGGRLYLVPARWIGLRNFPDKYLYRYEWAPVDDTWARAGKRPERLEAGGRVRNAQVFIYVSISI